METNALPTYDTSDNPTGCCPRFDPEGWDRRHLHFDRKPFVCARTRSLFHVPLNMGTVFERTFEAIESAGASDPVEFIVLSQDESSTVGRHLFSVTKPVPGQEMVELTGDFETRVFEGPYKRAKAWHEELRQEAERKGGAPDQIYFFYTTCPKCAKTYGKNYVVGVFEISVG